MRTLIRHSYATLDSILHHPRTTARRLQHAVVTRLVVRKKIPHRTKVFQKNADKLYIQRGYGGRASEAEARGCTMDKQTVKIICAPVALYGIEVWLVVVAIDGAIKERYTYMSAESAYARYGRLRARYSVSSETQGVDKMAQVYITEHDRQSRGGVK